MSDALQDSEKVELEEEVQKTTPVAEDIEPDAASLAAVEREEKEKAAAEAKETFRNFLRVIFCTRTS